MATAILLVSAVVVLVLIAIVVLKIVQSSRKTKEVLEEYEVEEEGEEEDVRPKPKDMDVLVPKTNEKEILKEKKDGMDEVQEKDDVKDTKVVDEIKDVVVNEEKTDEVAKDENIVDEGDSKLDVEKRGEVEIEEEGENTENKDIEENEVTQKEDKVIPKEEPKKEIVVEEEKKDVEKVVEKKVVEEKVEEKIVVEEKVVEKKIVGEEKVVEKKIEVVEKKVVVEEKKLEEKEEEVKMVEVKYKLLKDVYLGLEFHYPSNFKVYKNCTPSVPTLNLIFKPANEVEKDVFKTEELLVRNEYFEDPFPKYTEVAEGFVKELGETFNLKNLSNFKLSNEVSGFQYKLVSEKRTTEDRLMFFKLPTQWITVHFRVLKTLKKRYFNFIKFIKSLKFHYLPLICKGEIIFCKSNVSLTIPSFNFKKLNIQNKGILFCFGHKNTKTNKNDMIMLVKKDTRENVVKLLRGEKNLENIKRKEISKIKVLGKPHPLLFSTVKNGWYVYELPFLFNKTGYRYVFRHHGKPTQLIHKLILKIMSSIRLSTKERKELMLYKSEAQLFIHLPINNVKKIVQFPSMVNPLLRLEHLGEGERTEIAIKNLEGKTEFKKGEFLDLVKKILLDTVVRSNIKEVYVNNMTAVQGMVILKGGKKKQYVTFVLKGKRMAMIKSTFKREITVGSERITFHSSVTMQ